MLIAYELIHSFHTKNLKHKFMVIKLDITKAFDKLNDVLWMQLWKRLLPEMEKLDIEVHYYIYLYSANKRRSVQSIKPQCKLIQNDLILPYLYILCTSVLSRLIKHNIQKQKIHGFMAYRNGTPVFHLLFADDSMVFCRATTEKACNL